MNRNSLPPGRQERPLSHLKVALLGFEAADEEKLNRALQYRRAEGRHYVVAESTAKTSSHILLVNYDNPTALGEKDSILIKHPKIQVVAVSKGPLQPPFAHHIRGMLVTARVLSVIDKVSIESCVLSTTDFSQTAAEIHEPVVADASVAESQIPVEIPYPLPLPLPAVKDATGYRVLVVDDSPAIQKSLELNLATLPQIGVIDFADSGEDAIDKAANSRYDLIFLDVMMPGMDGYDTCALLRKNPEYKKAPIIMVSGKSSPLDEVKGIMAGSTTYLIKPVEPDAFKKVSRRVLAWLDNQKPS
jgi:two-component system cell cycle response regulator